MKLRTWERVGLGLSVLALIREWRRARRPAHAPLSDPRGSADPRGDGEPSADAVMATLGEAVVVHDTAGNLVYANDAAARLLGFESAKAAIATPPAEIREEF